MKKLITKGNWFYEIQILMWVIMWQHDMNYSYNHLLKPGLHLGRLYICYDTAWLEHGVVGAINDFWIDLTKNTKNLKRWNSKWIIIRYNVVDMFSRWYHCSKYGQLIMSIRAFIELTSAGFRISHSTLKQSKPSIYCMYRFWWKQDIIIDMADIDRVGDHWSTMFNGSSKLLTHDNATITKQPKTNYKFLALGNIILLVVMIIVLALMACYNGVWNVNAPELFGEGTSYFFQTNDHIYGIIETQDYWAFYGTAEDCRIVQLSGPRIGGQIDGKVPCRMNFAQGNHFSGWIDFRGHTRPFCGAIADKELPNNCFSK